MPAKFKDRMPRSDLSIQALGSRLDGVLQGTYAGSGKDLLSTQEANTSLEVLFEACLISPKACLDEMQQVFGQLWFDDRAKSVIDWFEPTTRYPLSALTIYWEFA